MCLNTSEGTALLVDWEELSSLSDDVRPLYGTATAWLEHEGREHLPSVPE